MRNAATITEADILAEVVAPRRGGLSAEAARSLLSLKFKPRTTQRIRRLLGKNNRGTITPEERLTLDKYLRVGLMLDLLQAKARLALRQSAE